MSGDEEGAGRTRVIIIGAGIVGCSTAYYLRKKAEEKGVSLDIAVVDSVGIAAAASGRAGGFLARDWHGRGPTAELARRSFRLHAELAKVFGADKIGYRSVCAVQPTCPSPDTGTGCWFSSREDAPIISETSVSAQVIPERLVRSLFAASKATLCVGHVNRVLKGSNGFHIEVEYETSLEEEDIEKRKGDVVKKTKSIFGSAVLFAAGPWTSDLVFEATGIQMKETVIGQKAASILLKPNEGAPPIDARMLFVNWVGPGNPGELEVYPRIDGLYVCGCGSSSCTVRERPGAVRSTNEARDTLLRCAAAVCPLHFGSSDDDVEIAASKFLLRSTACYLPVTRSGIVAGKIGRRLFVASGHSCWGILNGPATGKGMASMILSDVLRRAKGGAKTGKGDCVDERGTPTEDPDEAALLPFAPADPRAGGGCS